MRLPPSRSDSQRGQLGCIARTAHLSSSSSLHRETAAGSRLIPLGKTMQTYSPFDKRTEELSSEDLEVLKTVHEGWYVEYKSDLVSSSALAKAVSAFANTYSGWLFLGVKERSKTDAVAGSFPGIPRQDSEVAVQRLRKSCTDHLNPSPYFTWKILNGPCKRIGLPEGRIILAVEIPQSNSAPHVHKDGRIYRRVADSSEPKHETDRFVLDQIWRRGDPVRKTIREWIERDPEFSQTESDTPYLRLLLCVDPWCQRDPWLDAPISQIRTILAEDEPGLSSTPFDTVYPVWRGFVARQVANNYANILGLTWKMQRNMSGEIVLPLPVYGAESPGLLAEHLCDYEYGQRYIAMLKNQGLGHMIPKVADFNFTVHVLIGVISKYRRLLRLAGAVEKYYVKARLINAWRKLPFFDVSAVVAEFERYGVPMFMGSTVSVPEGHDPDSFLYIEDPAIDERDGREQIASGLQAFEIFVNIAIALGIPVTVDFDGEQRERAIAYNEWMDAGGRAIQRQHERHK